VGALARLALPGPDPMSLFATIMIGLAGSFIAGAVTLALFGSEWGGLLLSQLSAVVILYFVRRSRGGGWLDPGEPRR
jgi:uncharacterized membrane protein YeaQ/YmgE (transglycosylase-associated protein family)